MRALGAGRGVAPAALSRAGRQLPGRLAATILLAYASARAADAGLVLLVRAQIPERHIGAWAGFSGWHDLLDRWDVGAYELIARHGYPAHLPIDALGRVAGNEWAFFPGFPFATRLVSTLADLRFENAAVVLNLGAGALAAVLIGAVVARFADDRAAFHAAALWSFFPTAVLLQVPYSEAMFAALAAAFLLATLSRRNLVAAGLLMAAALTRGYAVPLTAAALTSVAMQLPARLKRPRWCIWRWSPELLVLSGAAVVAPFLWPIIAAEVTGRPDAYAATQRAWGYTPNPLTWAEHWPQALAAATRSIDGALPVIVCILVVAATVVALRFDLPVELKAYAVASAAFLFIAAPPGSVAFGALPRFSFIILTLPIVAAVLMHRRRVIVTVAISLALQYLWILEIWSGRHGIAP